MRQSTKCVRARKKCPNITASVELVNYRSTQSPPFCSCMDAYTVDIRWRFAVAVIDTPAFWQTLFTECHPEQWFLEQGDSWMILTKRNQ